MYLLCFRRGELSLRRRPGRFRPTRRVLGKALHISLPMGLQQGIMCSAYVATTLIIAPLGTFAIAANSFGIIIESLCYMPGYGIADAATTLVGQSLGAARHELMKRFAWLSVLLGMAVMAVMGVVMYVGAPFAMSLMTPVSEVRSLGAGILRIEAFAEPMFAAAIVSYGVFVGAAQTLVPSPMNLASMWGVRITLAALLAPHDGTARRLARHVHRTVFQRVHLPRATKVLAKRKEQRIGTGEEVGEVREEVKEVREEVKEVREVKEGKAVCFANHRRSSVPLTTTPRQWVREEVKEVIGS